jgi:dipeptidyl aminopeptidase/acylaminoacyl peptidase
MQYPSITKLLSVFTLAIIISVRGQAYAETKSSRIAGNTHPRPEKNNLNQVKDIFVPTSGTIRRNDGSDLIYYTLNPSGKSFPVVLYLDGSSCASVYSMIPYVTPFLEAGYGMLTLEKKGIESRDTGTPCSKEYLESNDRYQRVNDALLLLSETKRLFPNWDGRTIIMGASEGGAIAPEIAYRYPQSSAVVSLAGGGMSQSWELKKLNEKELLAAEASTDTIRVKLRKLDEKFDEIRKSTASTKTWYGDNNTYKRWDSYLWSDALAFFSKLVIPVYVAHGTGDKNAPVESADSIRDRFASLGKHNLTYKRYEGLDHHWTTDNGENHTPQVIGNCLDWLLRTIPPATPVSGRSK